MKYYYNHFSELMEKLKSLNVHFTDEGSFIARLPYLAQSLWILLEGELGREGLLGSYTQGASSLKVPLKLRCRQRSSPRETSSPSLHIFEPSQCPVPRDHVETEKCFAFNHLNNYFQMITSIVAKLSRLFSDFYYTEQILGRGKQLIFTDHFTWIISCIYPRVLWGRFYYHL